MLQPLALCTRTVHRHRYNNVRGKACQQVKIIFRFIHKLSVFELLTEEEVKKMVRICHLRCEIWFKVTNTILDFKQDSLSQRF